GFEEIHCGHTVGELSLMICTYINMCYVEEIRLEQIHCGTGIVDRAAFDTVMVFIRPAEKLKQLRDENRNFIIRTTEPLLNLFIGNYLMGHIKSKHGKGHTALVNDFCRFRIHIDIEFRSRCPVAECAAAHEYDLLYIVLNIRGLDQCKCDICQLFLCRSYRFNYETDSMLLFFRYIRFRQFRSVHARTAVYFRCYLAWLHHRPRCSLMDGDIQFQQFAYFQRIDSVFSHFYIA